MANKRSESDNRAISPVIGVVLMVGIVVTLGAVVGVAVLGIGTGIGDTSPNVQFDATYNNVEDELTVTHVAGDTIDADRLSYADGFDGEFTGQISAGDSATFDVVDSETFEITWTAENGETSSTIFEYDIPGFDNTLNVFGGVTVNPDIEGATVESRDSNGNILATTETDENGEYEIEAPEGGNILVNAQGEDTVNGNEFFAGATRSVSDEVNFDFIDDEATEVGGETIQVAYQTEQTSENHIVNPQQLQAIGVDLSGEYVLKNDIDLENLNAEYEPIGSGDEFTGVLDGDGNTITNVNVEVSEDNPTGLISAIDNAEVRDLTVSGEINEEQPIGYDPTGLVAGEADDSVVENVEVESIELNLRGDVNEPVVSGSTGGVIGEASGSNEFTNIAVTDSIVVDTNGFVDNDIVGEEFAGVINNGLGSESEYTNIVLDGDFTITGEAEDSVIDDGTAGVINDPVLDSTFEDISMNGDFTIDAVSNSDDIVGDETAGVINSPDSESVFDGISLNGDFTIEGETEDSVIGFSADTAGVISDPSFDSTYNDISLNGDFTIDAVSTDDELINSEVAGVITSPGGESEFGGVSLNGDFTITGEAEDEIIDDGTAGVISSPGFDSTYNDISLNGDFTIDAVSNSDEIVGDETAGVISSPGFDSTFNDVSLVGNFTINGESEEGVIGFSEQVAGVISTPGGESEFTGISMNGDFTIDGTSQEELVNGDVAGVMANPGFQSTVEDVSMDGDFTITGESEDEFIDGDIAGAITNPGGESEFTDISMNGDFTIDGISNNDVLIDDRMAGAITSIGFQSTVEDVSMDGDFSITGESQLAFISDVDVGGLISGSQFQEVVIVGDLEYTGTVIVEEESENGAIAGIIAITDPTVNVEQLETIDAPDQMIVDGEEVTVETSDDVALIDAEESVTQ